MWPEDHEKSNTASYTALSVEDSIELMLTTSGSWASLQIEGGAGFNIVFSDVDAFVRNTGHLLFVSDCMVGGCKSHTLVHQACDRQDLDCFEPSHKYTWRRSPYFTCEPGRELSPKGWATYCLSNALEVLKSGETSKQQGLVGE